MKIALVHDYLIQDGGAERVLLSLHRLYPDAPIFTLFYDPTRSHPEFHAADIRPSWLDRLPTAHRHYEWLLPFMAQAVEGFDLTGFDLVISSSSSFAKGVIVPPGALHVNYCHSPTRFLWHDRLSYLNDLPRPLIVKSLLPSFLHRLRQWDAAAAQRPDVLLTNSRTSQARIRRYYRREASIVHPPVEVDHIPLSTVAGSYWLAGGRLVAYKRFDLIVKAFNKLGLPLKIFGQGPEEKKLRRMAGPKTEFTGTVDDATKVELYQHAVGFLYPQVEDFGITALEAMAAGKPVIAYREGGAGETVIDGVTGRLFDEQGWENLGLAVRRFDPAAFSPERIRRHAEQFSERNFQHRFASYVQSALAERYG